MTWHIPTSILIFINNLYRICLTQPFKHCFSYIWRHPFFIHIYHCAVSWINIFQYQFQFPRSEYGKSSDCPPYILLSSGITQNHTSISSIVQTNWICRALHMLVLLMLIVKCPFYKIKIWWCVSTALKKGYRLIYRNTQIDSPDTVPLKGQGHEILFG